MRFVLASSSPRRREILSDLIDNFEIIKPDIEESQHPDEAPIEYVKRLSRQKAQAVAMQVEDDAAILAADTVVILAADTIGIESDGEILGKPTDADDARAILKRLRNRPHQVCTAFTLMNGHYIVTRMVATTVHMRDYTDDEIDAYIATGDPFDKAGSYAIQHEDFHPVDRIDGSYTNVVGLPTEALKQEMITAGIQVKGVPYQIQHFENLVEDFIPTDDPLSVELDERYRMLFAICVVKMDDKFLLHYNPERNQWEHAGGGIEDGEHPDDTAVREVFEETSQHVKNVKCLGVMKITFLRQGVTEYAPLYIGEIDELAPFTPNNETSKLLLWDVDTPLDGLLSQVTYAILKLL